MENWQIVVLGGIALWALWVALQALTYAREADKRTKECLALLRRIDDRIDVATFQLKEELSVLPMKASDEVVASMKRLATYPGKLDY